ncbi:glutathione S-transferase family protein [Synechocystis sp. PCC 7509]|uniref:glutathione S-transferase family protein n=1 Tax=Synechocystis sp. PCC 7509 TaxID=927677 RepID=UPI0002AC05B5|nr:glutathione S-transferase family protein [Synechocystis sp. PCC 7509]
MTIAALSWTELEALTNFEIDTVNGATNAQAQLRLFGGSESQVRVTLYRDNHAWCPYCQKIWLWLEEKQIPYRIEKVTMFCYGEKESWYKRKVPSGMLPAIELDGRIITESDDILIALEQVYEPLGLSMLHPKVLPLRQLERRLFREWCSWLCYPSSARKDQENRERFINMVAKVETAIAATPSPYFLEEFGTVDVIFTPYIERMNASLYYYKGYSLREEHPRLSDWFTAMETRPTYRGTQSDFHTHAHDLPPQMGGCFANGEPQNLINQQRVDCGPWDGLPDATYPEEPTTSRLEALYRVMKHRANIIRVNPSDDALIDTALRCTLTHLMTHQACPPPPGSDKALRYLRDRINVPRDMSIYAARRLRESLEITAALAGKEQGTPIETKHRRDQNPANFVKL